MTIRESAIEGDNRTYALTLRITPRKLNFGEGWPDRMYLYLGHILFVEYKQLGEKPTKLQLWMHENLRKQGFLVFVIDDKAKGRKLLKDWHDRIDNNLAEIRGNHDQDKRLGSYVRGNPWLE